MDPAICPPCPDPTTLPISTGIPNLDLALSVAGQLVIAFSALGIIPSRWPWIGVLGRFGKRFWPVPVAQPVPISDTKRPGE